VSKAFCTLDAMLLRFLGATPLRGVGLSAPIPQPPYGRLAGFPLQSLARLAAIWSCQTAAMPAGEAPREVVIASVSEAIQHGDGLRLDCFGG
jgi:hypothetical protein